MLQAVWRDAGHLQFEDANGSLKQSVCATGRGVDNADVSRYTARLVAAFVRATCGTCTGSGGGSRVHDGGVKDEGEQESGVGCGVSAEMLRSACEGVLEGAPLRWELSAK